MVPLAIRFYDVVVWLHVAAIIVAFGVTFVYPLLLSRLTRAAPESLPGVFAAMSWIGRAVITPAMVVALLAGIYLATDAEVWDRTWVAVPLVILIILFGMGGAFFSPTEHKLAALATRDVAEDRAAGRPITFSAEYQAMFRRLVTGGLVASTLVLIALYFMVVKPFP